MAKAKKSPPFNRQGLFCVVVYDRESQSYTLMVDAGKDKPDTYLFTSIEAIHSLLIPERFWNLGRAGDELIHMAKEFGAAHIAFQDMRPIPEFDRNAVPKITFDSEDGPLGFFELPQLRPSL